MTQVKKHFEEEAHQFDQIIRQLIPYYEEMLNALVLAVPYEKSQPIEVIDLGCGTGTVARRIKDAYSNSKVTCVDLTENMLEMAKTKLGSDTRYQLTDFRTYQFDETYDLVVSSLALHHLPTDQEKRLFCKKIFDALAPGGAFQNADVILASSNRVQDGYIEKWKDFMRRHISDDEIENKWIPMYYEENRPTRLVDQMSWLEDLGFTKVDVVWKYYNFALYGGTKSGQQPTVRNRLQVLDSDLMFS